MATTTTTTKTKTMKVFFTDLNNNIEDVKLPSSCSIYRRFDYYFIRDGDFDIVWRNVVIFIVGHVLWLYGLIIVVNERPVETWMYSVVIMYIIGTSVGAGAHRLWSHRSYKASTALKVMLGHTLGGHNSVFTWARDHRVHHKFSDTDGDPHNTRRGFFFAHCGWLLRKKHPELRVKSSGIEFTDLYNDPVLTFQRRYYFKIYVFIGFFIPMAVPVWCWGESWFNSFMVTYCWRLVNTQMVPSCELVSVGVMYTQIE